MPTNLENQIPEKVPPFKWSLSSTDIDHIKSLEETGDPIDYATAFAFSLGCVVLQHPSLSVTAVLDMDDLMDKISLYQDGLLLKDITAHDCQGVSAIVASNETGDSIDRIIFGVNKIMEKRLKKRRENEEEKFNYFGSKENETKDIRAEIYYPSNGFSGMRYWLVRFYGTGGDLLKENRFTIMEYFLYRPKEPDIENLQALISASMTVLR